MLKINALDKLGRFQSFQSFRSRPNNGNHLSTSFRELDGELKMAMVMMRCPEPLGEHFRLNAEVLGSK